MNHSDPIIAIATASGRAGIGVVRVSGSNLAPLVQALFNSALTPRQAHYRTFKRFTDGSAIDSGLVLFFKGPQSYTGEDVLELQGHGGTAVLRQVLNNCLQAGKAIGLRHAQPGEFTQRAFLNGRLDLAQAEAVADLIDASSEAAATGAMASLSGVFSKQVNQLNEQIIHLRMLVEATLDFPEEEIDFLEKYQAAQTLGQIRHDLHNIIEKSRQGMILREGLHVVLAGQPNVGKSSLLNALAGDEIAIVTPIAGTTRDKVVQQIHIQGVPIHIVDTAGLRETDDVVESIGIERTWAEIARADLIIHLQDARAPGDPLDQAIVERLPERTPLLNVFNKIDLVAATSRPDLAQQNSQPSQEHSTAPHLNAVSVSAKTGQGLETLRQTLLDFAGWNPSAESPWLARERHITALNLADEHLAMAAAHAAQNDAVLDLFAEELRLAHESLAAITGEFTSDDLLGEIFSSFCIGK